MGNSVRPYSAFQSASSRLDICRAAQIAELELVRRQLSAMEVSTSWRKTYPLRDGTVSRGPATRLRQAGAKREPAPSLRWLSIAPVSPLTAGCGCRR
jgi:hypothetical protein